MADCGDHLSALWEVCCAKGWALLLSAEHGRRGEQKTRLCHLDVIAPVEYEDETRRQALQGGQLVCRAGAGGPHSLEEAALGLLAALRESGELEEEAA